MNDTNPESEIIDCDADPFVYEGMSVYSHKKTGKTAWKDLNPVLWQWDQQKVDDGISGHLLARELASKPVLNANVLWFLVKNQELIPEEWQEKNYVCFWGTVYLNGTHGLYVETLHYGERGWDVVPRELDEMFDIYEYAVLGSSGT